MDVFALARHEYLQPPMPKHGRQTAQQQQAAAQQQSTIGNQSSGVSVGQSAASAAAAFSTGLFGNMNQSSSS